MAKKKYSCDFETTTDSQDCRVWAYGHMEIGNRDNYKIGNSIDDFMTFVKECQGICFFHNLRFDGEFIVNWLLQNGFTHSDSGKANTFNCVISNMGQWYIIDVCYGYKTKRNGGKGDKLHTIIYDSLKKLPFPVKKIAEDFKLPIKKGDIDYHKYRPIGHEITEEEHAYIKNDIEIIAQALEIQFDQGLEKITNGSDSLHNYKATIGGNKVFEKMFPVFDRELDKQLRKCYKGGFTWLNDRFANAIVGNGLVFDVNSLYPAVMYDRELPYGNPIKYEGKYEPDENYPLYIQSFNCDFKLKEGKIPMIQIKKNLMFKGNEYIKNSNAEYPELCLTNVDMEMFFDHYDVFDIEYTNGYKFKKRKGVFKDFIDKWTYIKINNTGAIKLLAKLMLNSLYGKFGSSPNVTGKVPFLKPDGSVGYRLGDEEFKDPIYLPMAAFITSYARELTISTAQKCFDRIIYCDTDSIHLTGLTMPEAISDLIDDNMLGHWAHETTFKRGKYIRQKTYVYEACEKNIGTEEKEKWVPCIPDEAEKVSLIVKCAGMPDTVKKKVTFDNFKVGFTATGKLLPQHVNGGVVLIDTDFTIK